jgi:DNA replication licensing factor MCM2
MRERGDDDEEDEDDEGEDLFNERDLAEYVYTDYDKGRLTSSDYASNDRLDAYSQDGLDDRSEIAEMTAAQRRQAEEAMRRRDAGRPSGRSRRRDFMPAFLGSDDVEEGAGEGLLSGIRPDRQRRHYDERMDVDDVAEAVSRRQKYNGRG